MSTVKAGGGTGDVRHQLLQRRWTSAMNEPRERCGRTNRTLECKVLQHDEADAGERDERREGYKEWTLVPQQCARDPSRRQRVGEHGTHMREVDAEGEGLEEREDGEEGEESEECLF